MTSANQSALVTTAFNGKRTRSKHMNNRNDQPESRLPPEFREDPSFGQRMNTQFGQLRERLPEGIRERPTFMSKFDEGLEQVRDRLPDGLTRKSKYMGNLTRSASNKLIAGVLGGIGERFGIEPNMLRFIYAAALVFTFFVPFLVLYLVAMVLFPEEE